MIVDLRIYSVRPGQLDTFVALYRDKAWPLQLKYLQRCLGWYTTIEGQLGQVVHLWAFDSQADREDRRTRMAADPEWQAYLKASAAAGLLVAQENRFLKPTAFYLETTKA